LSKDKQRSLSKQFNQFSLLDIVVSTSFLTMYPFNWLYCRYGREKLGRTSKTLKKLSGLFSLSDYYEGIDAQLNRPFPKNSIKERHISKVLALNIEDQVQLLERFVDQLNITTQEHERSLSSETLGKNGLHYKFLDLFIQDLKPKQVIEIGSGPQTIIVNRYLNMLSKSEAKSISHSVYDSEAPDAVKRLPNVNLSSTSETENVDWENSLIMGDLLVIHPSNLYPPKEERLMIYNEFIPRLNKGVCVLFVDTYPSTSYDNPWLYSQLNSWKEVDLLQILLTNFTRYEVLALLSNLKTSHAHLIDSLSIDIGSEGGDIYIKVR